jgi:RNA 3'-terminal phosphate cyclase (ATP)
MSLAAITGRAVQIRNIRAGRPKPGLAAQHLTAIRSAAAVCAAEVSGATLGSAEIGFRPCAPPIAGSYCFDVAEARAGGSAGAATLVLQTVAMPAHFATGTSRFRILGGTHIATSPTFDYVREVWMPLLKRTGVRIEAELEAFGFFPLGGGEIAARVEGSGGHASRALQPLDLIERGSLLSISGRAIAANLPAHIPERMAERARALLGEAASHVDIETCCVRASCAGAALFLSARYEGTCVGFSSLGARGKPSETVAEEAAGALLAHRQSGASIDRHLADQILLPLALACGPSTFTCEAATRHLKTNAWVIEQFGVARVRIEERTDASAQVTVTPQWAPPARSG